MLLGRYLGLPLLLFAAILQSAVLLNATIREGRIDLVLILVCCYALFAGPEEGALWGIFGGVALDLAGNQTLGVTSLIMVIITWIAGSISGGRRNLLVTIGLVGAATIGYHALLTLWFIVNGRQVTILNTLFYVTLPSALLNMLATIPIHRAFRLIFRRATPRRIGIE